MNRLFFEVSNKIITLDSWSGELDNIGKVVIDLLKKVYDILIILIPITLLVMGTLDLLKATGGQDEKSIAAAKSSLAKRATAAVIALIAMLIAKMIFKVVSGGEWGGFF